MQIGQLQRVPLRELLANEALDFTTWLAENLDFVGETLGSVHHGYEIANVKYEDRMVDTLEPVKLGIHLKSRTTSKKQGLGRSTRRIKALYTQLFYSAYLALVDPNVEFDVLGISVPNTLKHDVITSMTYLVNDLGFQFLVIDEEEWFKIITAVLEQLEIEEQD